METRANYAIIGIFTLAVIVAGFGFVFWFAGTESGVDRPMYRVEFSGSVAGLSKGSPVLFNGIRIGEVTTVDLSETAPDQAFATIQVQKTAPIRKDTKAALDVNLLSGVAQVALTGGAANAPPLEKRDQKDPFPTIVADQGGLGSVVQTAKGTAEKANVLLDLVTEVVKGNRGNIDASVANVRTFTDALASNSAKIDTFLGSVAEAANKIGPVAAKLEVLTDNATALVQAIEPDRMRAIVRNVEGVTQTVEENRTNLANLFREAAGLAGRLNETAPKLDQAITDLSRTIAVVDPVKVNQVIDNTQRFTASLSASTEDLQGTLRNANSLSAKLNASADGVQAIVQTLDQNREKVATFLRDAASLAGRLNESAPKLDRILGDVSRTVAAVDATKLNHVVENAERFTAGLSASTPDLQGALRNSNSLTAKLNASADRIDGVLKAAESFLGSAAGREGKSTFESIRTAMDAFRKASENLERRATEIAQSVGRFSGSGSRQVEALGTDARRAVNTVGRAARTLEQNPSSVIFGSGRPPIPEYGGR